MGRRLLVRADALHGQGTGHIMRCLALADKWTEEQGPPTTFVTAAIPEAVATRIRSHGHRIAPLNHDPGTPNDLKATANLVEARGPIPVVVDGYHFGPSYLEGLRAVSERLAYVDDILHLDRYPVDILVNPSSRVTSADVPNPANITTFLLGPDYVLLRPEFARYHDWTRDHPEQIRTLLVTLGGTDPDGLTADLLTRLKNEIHQPVTIKVITRAASANLGAIESVLKTMEGNHRLSLDVDDMAERMAEADAAISAGGGTAWELSYMQVPALLGRLAENQNEVVRTIANAGAGVDLGWWSDLDENVLTDHLEGIAADRSRRTSMGKAGRRLVDGRGTARVVGELVG